MRAVRGLPERSMQAVAWDETKVSGPGKIELQLETPKPFYLKFNPKLVIFPPQFIKDMTFGF